MRVRLFFAGVLMMVSALVSAQTSVPLAVKSELARRYPNAKNTAWSKNGNNYEAKWNSKADGQSQATFTPFGAFVGITTVTPIEFLPASISSYIKGHYKSTIADARKNVSVMGKITYRIKTKAGKTVVFDQDGKCLSR